MLGEKDFHTDTGNIRVRERFSDRGSIFPEYPHAHKIKRVIVVRASGQLELASVYFRLYAPYRPYRTRPVQNKNRSRVVNLIRCGRNRFPVSAVHRGRNYLVLSVFKFKRSVLITAVCHKRPGIGRPVHRRLVAVKDLVGFRIRYGYQNPDEFIVVRRRSP